MDGRAGARHRLCLISPMGGREEMYVYFCSDGGARPPGMAMVSQRAGRWAVRMRACRDEVGPGAASLLFSAHPSTVSLAGSGVPHASRVPAPPCFGSGRGCLFYLPASLPKPVTRLVTVTGLSEQHRDWVFSPPILPGRAPFLLPKGRVRGGGFISFYFPFPPPLPRARPCGK